MKVVSALFNIDQFFDTGGAENILELVQRLNLLKEDYSNFISSIDDGEEAARENYMMKFKNSCNAADLKPIDAIDRLDDGAQVIFQGISDLETLRDFESFITGAMMMASILHVACLPINADTCTDFEDDEVFEDQLETIEAARVSIAGAIAEAQQRIEDEINNGNEDERNRFALCRINSRGYPVPENDAEFDTAEIRFSSENSPTKPEYMTDSKEVLETTNNSIDVIQAGIGAVMPKDDVFQAMADTGKKKMFAAMKKLSTALSVLGPTLALVMAFVPAGPDATVQLIQAEFKKLNERLDRLESSLTSDFNEVKIDLGEVVLDQEFAVLQRIKFAFQNYASLGTMFQDPSINPDYKSLRKLYTEEFRFACNELDFRPADIIRNLYGHACGDEDFSKRCGSDGGKEPFKNGESTGTCKYGIKKQGYLLDTFWSSSESVLKYRKFASFMRSSLTEAMFLQAVCLPSTIDMCPIEDNIILRKELEQSSKALNEVLDNLEKIEECTCPCKMIHLKELWHQQSDDPDVVILRVRLDFGEEQHVRVVYEGDSEEYEGKEKWIPIKGDTVISLDGTRPAEVVNFDDPDNPNIEGIPFPLLTQMRFYLQENDDVTNDNFEYFMPRDEFWQYKNENNRDTCAKYEQEVTLVEMTGSAEIKFKFDVYPQSCGGKCDISNGIFCDDDQMCDAENGSCIDKPTLGDECRDINTYGTNQCDSVDASCVDVLGTMTCKITCISDDDCENDLICNTRGFCNDRASEACANDSDCTENENDSFCKGGLCVKKINQGFVCVQGDVCVDSSTCVEGFCEGNPCDDDSVCNGETYCSPDLKVCTSKFAEKDDPCTFVEGINQCVSGSECKFSEERGGNFCLE